MPVHTLLPGISSYRLNGKLRKQVKININIIARHLCTIAEIKFQLNTLCK
jgi:hypothetical protein